MKIRPDAAGIGPAIAPTFGGRPLGPTEHHRRSKRRKVSGSSPDSTAPCGQQRRCFSVRRAATSVDSSASTASTSTPRPYRPGTPPEQLSDKLVMRGPLTAWETVRSGRPLRICLVQRESHGGTLGFAAGREGPNRRYQEVEMT